MNHPIFFDLVPKVSILIDMITTSVFQHGGSQAVRLPKEARFSCTRVEVRKTKEGVLLIPIPEEENRKKKFLQLAGSCADFPLVDRPQKPDERDFVW